MYPGSERVDSSRGGLTTQSNHLPLPGLHCLALLTVSHQGDNWWSKPFANLTLFYCDCLYALPLPMSLWSSPISFSTVWTRRISNWKPWHSSWGVKWARDRRTRGLRGFTALQLDPRRNHYEDLLKPFVQEMYCSIIAIVWHFCSASWKMPLRN